EQQSLALERVLEDLRRALEAGRRGDRQVDLALDTADGGDGIAQREARRQVEGDGDRGQLALVVDGDRSDAGMHRGERRQWHRYALGRRQIEPRQVGRVALEVRIDLED